MNAVYGLEYFDIELKTAQGLIYCWTRPEVPKPFRPGPLK